MELKLKEPRKAIEWTIHHCRDFSVIVRGWTYESLDGVKNNWNVYANIFDSHPLFGNVNAMLSLPFHGGPTYEKLITTEPAQGIRYDFEKVAKTYKIGSDYAHYMDHYEDHPADAGIPPSVLFDANELVRELFESSTLTGAA